MSSFDASLGLEMQQHVSFTMYLADNKIANSLVPFHSPRIYP